VRLKIDFRGPDVGTFVFHCHILGHEDLGMMNIIQVVPAGSGAVTKPGVGAEKSTPATAKVVTKTPASSMGSMPGMAMDQNP